ncbi:MAG: transposase [Blautia sp.]|uniref:transposase n=1 Tax=Blautia sp. TaxID=1955243 RepID=UPI002A751478|nr:transposase [Blautia sp.]MDY3016781.1 transposase [Blautia sp.]
MDHLKRMNIKPPVLVIFDRGYPSMEFIDFLETEKINYLFRLSSNDYKFERKNMASTDEVIPFAYMEIILSSIEEMSF